MTKMITVAFIALFAALLLTGCLGGGEQPPVQENKTNQTNATTVVNIIVQTQTNQTMGQNITAQPPEENVSVANVTLYEYNPNQTFAVYFLYVGGPGLHGNAVLIRKGGLSVLVDAGPAENAGKVLDFLRSHEVHRLDVIVSTNADPRNYGGIGAVADAFPVQEFWWTGEAYGDQAYSALAQRMTNATKRVRIVERGFTQDLNGMEFRALNPPTTQRFEDVNNDAAVFRVSDRNFTLLLTSGIQTGAQGRLLNDEKENIQTQVMQAPYYGVGSGTSNIGIFLITAKPKDMIISGSGDESPANGGSREPFKRLMKQYGIAYYENYVNGTLRISSDGSSYAIQAVKG